MAQGVSYRSLIAKTTFDFRSVHVIFVVNEVALGHPSLWVLRFSSDGIISIHQRSILIFNERTNGRSLETFKRAMFLQKSGNIEKVSIHFSVLASIMQRSLYTSRHNNIFRIILPIFILKLHHGARGGRTMAARRHKQDHVRSLNYLTKQLTI
jgi:hypothetical protein